MSKQQGTTTKEPQVSNIETAASIEIGQSFKHNGKVYTRRAGVAERRDDWNGLHFIVSVTNAKGNATNVAITETSKLEITN